MVAWPSGVRLGLSPEDEEVKRKLSKCTPRAYSELIRSDIPGSSGARLARLPFLRSSPLFIMKPPVSKSSSPSVSEPLIVKPTRGELRARLEVLEKKKRSVKRKPPNLPEGCPPARGKILKVGASFSPSSAVGTRDSSGRAAEPPLEVLPISVWSPMSRGVVPSLVMPDEVTGDCDHFKAAGSEVSLLSHAKLAVGAVSSILHDSDLRKVDALSVEEALDLLLQGTASIRPSAFVDLFLYCFSSQVNVGAEVLSGAFDRAPLLGDLRVPPRASSSALPAGAPPFNSSTSTSRGSTSGV